MAQKKFKLADYDFAAKPLHPEDFFNLTSWVLKKVESLILAIE